MQRHGGQGTHALWQEARQWDGRVPRRHVLGGGWQRMERALGERNGGHGQSVGGVGSGVKDGVKGPRRAE